MVKRFTHKLLGMVYIVMGSHCTYLFFVDKAMQTKIMPKK